MDELIEMMKDMTEKLREKAEELELTEATMYLKHAGRTNLDEVECVVFEPKVRWIFNFTRCKNSSSEWVDLTEVYNGKRPEGEDS